MGDVYPAIGGAGVGLGQDYMRTMIQHAIEQRDAYRLSSPQDLQLATVPGSATNEMSMTQDITHPGPTATLGNALRAFQDTTPWSMALWAGSAAFSGGMFGEALRIARNVHELHSQIPNFRPRYFEDKSPKNGTRAYRMYNLKSSRRKYSRKRF